jgi:serine/threonine-protein kinase
MERRIGRYRIGKQIAAGGMAEVFVAHTDGADGFRKPLAIKRIRRELLGDPEVVRRFSQEARLAQRLVHGNVVQVVDFGSDEEGVPFLVMELIDGVSLQRLIQQPPILALPEALFIAEELCAALTYVHAARNDAGAPLGLVHRDIAPRNILVSREGVVKLADFGIARAALRDERTSTGVIKGKEGYFPPERDATPASDIYSLGATLHALLAGTPPLTTTIEMGRRFAGGRLPIDPSISPPLAKLVEACMDLEPRNRPSAADLHAAASRLAGADPARDLHSWLEVLKPIVAPVGLLDSLLQPALVAHVPDTRASHFDE